MRIYTDLANWFHLFTAPADYEEEAAAYAALLRGAVPEARTLLELGSGGGNNAWHLKRHFACTLSDLSPAMLAVSRCINPELEHITGDMRALRLGRLFDAVFVHDAIDHMATEEELAQAAATAYAHTRPGGVALFVPDCTLETFAPGLEQGGHDGDDGRALRYLEWSHPPQPGAAHHEVDYALLLRDSGDVRMVHERQVFALFPERQWREILSVAGFTVETPALEEKLQGAQVAFLCRRGDATSG